MKDLMNYEFKSGVCCGGTKVWKTTKGYAVEQWDNDWDDDNKIEYYTCIPEIPEEIDAESVGVFLDDLFCNHADDCYMTKYTYKAS